MEILILVVTVFGLIVFEVVSCVDNAIINAEILSTMGQKARRWFLTWGLLIAVFAARGLLPWVIVWIAAPQLGFIGSLTATFSNDPHVVEVIESAKPILLSGGGIFLVLLFFHWLFIEEKNYSLPLERFFSHHSTWFYALASVFLLVIVGLTMPINPMIAFSAVIGSTAFFITSGFKSNAEAQERRLKSDTGMSDWSKVLYLEAIDLTFSIDGVLGAFAFTVSIPLIIIGNGIGALVVRQLTVGNIDRIKRFRYLKNGAMYSILVLGAVMLGDSLGLHIPPLVTPLVTMAIVGIFFFRSVLANRRDAAAEANAEK